MMTPSKFLSTACPQTREAALDEVEARAYELHQERKANSARNYPWAEPLTFDGGEREFCRTIAREHIAQEAYTAERDEAVIASMAHMLDTDIQFQIDRISALQASLDYRLGTRMAVQKEDAKELASYTAELLRRKLAAPKPATLNDATAKVCADILSGA